MCQFREQNDDSGNGKYFELLPYILKDADTQLLSTTETLQLHFMVVNVIYQLILICPAALITTVLPQLVPVLVSMVREGECQSFRLVLRLTYRKEEQPLVKEIERVAYALGLTFM